MVEGEVIRWSEDKGFGYIRQDDGKLIMVEHSALNWPGYRNLHIGQRVSFDVKKTVLGPEAMNVHKLEQPA
jgi:CspA family cold shock protein